jgi:TolB protein
MDFLFLVSLLASQAPTVPLTGVRDSYPALSPDGRTLLFHSNRSGRQAIWASDADGGQPRLLFDDPASGSDPGTPAWSPDGSRIAFAMRPAGSADEEESDIYLIAADGKGLTRLTATPGDDSHPHWSRSGRIYFNSARATPDRSVAWSRQWIDIYSMDANGEDIRRHTDCRSVCTYPVPSPDERLIAYRAVTDSLALNWDLSPGRRTSEVFVIPIQGPTEPVNVSNDPAFDGWPAWSPDGRWLVFASNRARVAYNGQIYAIRPDGSGLHALTAGPLSRVQPSFTPDGSRILVNQNIEGANFEMGQIAGFPVRLDE